MKNEKPILFSTDMVRAILAGRKTQTRRVIKNVPAAHDFWIDRERLEYGYHGRVHGAIEPKHWRGMILWVRETWAENNGAVGGGGKYYYKAEFNDEEIRALGPWKPSIFMPRDACRLYLEIEDVRPERLQDISDEDIKAEGVELYPRDYTPARIERFKTAYNKTPLKFRWIQLWDGINSRRGYGWEQNPWVFVTKFKKI